ncbi:hypothetical protein ElyMa_004992800 [Elysia marginata]|uniref:Endoplasmic reticulum transmembrane protein n=1 Tax=Elysia marginata TaxID=1093978 RepID=A0AAV4J4U8_9GAST|nr:hypothetical protein ElyMa_004992800 [Elysia marginata]
MLYRSKLPITQPQQTPREKPQGALKKSAFRNTQVLHVRLRTNNISTTLVVISSVVEVSTVAVFILVSVVSFRNIRKWNRLYQVHKEVQVQAVIDYSRIDSSSSGSSDAIAIAHITIPSACEEKKNFHLNASLSSVKVLF